MDTLFCNFVFQVLNRIIEDMKCDAKIMSITA